MAELCAIRDCDQPPFANAMCGKHNARVKRTGNPYLAKRPTEADRFWSKVDKDGQAPLVHAELGPCWLWTASLAKKGYGQFHTTNKSNSSLAHRWAYESIHGAIPDGMTLDHLCRRTACVNPNHLEVVTVQENSRRGWSPVGRNARKTHCKRGHEFTPENTRLNKKGQRNCRACANEYQKAYQRKWGRVHRGTYIPASER